MSRARSGSDWARRASSTSDRVKPSLRLVIHVSNCLSSGVRVLGLGLQSCGGWGGSGGIGVVVSEFCREEERRAEMEIERGERMVLRATT